LNDPYTRFQVTLFFDAKYLRNGTRFRHSLNGILIGTYIRPTQQCFCSIFCDSVTIILTFIIISNDLE